jgi:lysophospholipase L1-like esterase
MLRLASLIVVAFAAANLAFHLAVQRSGSAARPIDLQTHAMVASRLADFFDREPGPARGGEVRAIFLGDSLMFGAHLEAREGHGWPARALPAQFAARPRAGTRHAALNLGVNGVLFSELACIAEDVLAHAPELLVINVSPRPFSADFAVDTTQTERAFLCPPTGLEGRALGLLGRALPVLGERDLAQLAWLGKPPRPWLLDHLKQGLSRLGSPEPEAPNEEDIEAAEVMRDMAWRLKAAARYNAIEVSASHPQMAALQRLLALVKAQSHTRVLILYVEENTAPVAAQLDAAHYAAQSAKFAELVEGALSGAARARFAKVPAERLSGHYVDHIHLDAAGYGILAQVVDELLPR